MYTITYKHTNVQAYVHTCIATHTHAYIHTHTHKQTNLHTHTHARTQRTHTHTRAHAHFTNIRTYMHTYMHTYIEYIATSTYNYNQATFLLNSYNITINININFTHNLLNILTHSLPSKRVAILMQTYQNFILPYPSDGSQKTLSKYMSRELYTIVSASR